MGEPGRKYDMLPLQFDLLNDPPRQHLASQPPPHVLVIIRRIAQCIIVEGFAGDEEAVRDTVREVPSDFAEGVDDCRSDDIGCRGGQDIEFDCNQYGAGVNGQQDGPDLQYRYPRSTLNWQETED